MKKWIITGDLKGAPTPEAKRAGTISDSAEARKATIAAYISEFIAKYEARFAKQSLPSGNENAMSRDLTWEIREALMRALISLQKEILAVDITSDEDDD
jgi:predicted component of type VI protein secretion system